MKISVKNLSRQFGRTMAVDGVSFEFESGQIIGFVGPNGAGKTTTMRIMATLDDPTGGDVRLDDISAVEYPEKVRRLVGFMPDAMPEHRDMSVLEYLDFFARAYGLKGGRRREMIDGIIDFTNLGGLREKTVASLSKGMKQRVSLARALVHDPAVLVLDEPAAALDPRARIELRELLRALADNGKAILISSHILTELAEIVHGVVIIEQGRLLRAGSMHQLSGHDSPVMTVAIRALGDCDSLYRTLLEMPVVQEARHLSHCVEVQLEGGDAGASALLCELVGRGVQVVEFSRRQVDLEDVFMSITKGEVQ